MASSLDKILALNASINMYMYVGSTNFGYWSGSNGGVPYNYNSITSYDYDSPISESGDTTWKYFTIKDTIAKYFPAPEIPVPSNSSKASLNGVKLESKGSLLTFFDIIANKTSYEKTKYPKTMEDMGFDYGFVLYRSLLNETTETGSELAFDYNGLGDRVTIIYSDEEYNNPVYLGTLENKVDDGVSMIITQIMSAGSYLVLIVENQGRVNYAPVMQDQSKGLRGNVTLNKVLVELFFIHFSKPEPSRYSKPFPWSRKLCSHQTCFISSWSQYWLEFIRDSKSKICFSENGTNATYFSKTESRNIIYTSKA